MCNVSELTGSVQCLWVVKRMLIYQPCLKIGRHKHRVPPRLKFIYLIVGLLFLHQGLFNYILHKASLQKKTSHTRDEIKTAAFMVKTVAQYAQFKETLLRHASSF